MATKYVVTDAQMRSIDRRVMDILRQLETKSGSPLDPEQVARDLTLIAEGVGFAPPHDSVNTVTVLDVPGPQLIAMAKKKLRFVFVDSYFETEDFASKVRGKAFEALLWEPETSLPREAVRSYFEKRGFYGNAAVFIAWAIKHDPHGQHATIPDSKKLYRENHGNLVPVYGRYENGRDRSVDRWGFSFRGGFESHGWHNPTTFVAFREVR